jgi:hypothetical protein
MSRRTIDADGNLLSLDESSGSNSGASNTGESHGLLRSLQSMPTIDVFGFNVPARQFWIGLAVIVIISGVRTGRVSLLCVVVNLTACHV